MMNDFLTLKSAMPLELTVKRHGLWRPRYELTDGVHSYGTLRHEGFWRSKSIIDTAEGNWVITGKGWSGAEIKNTADQSSATTSGNLLGTTVTFSAHDGFRATFTKPSIWKNTTVWKAEDGTALLSIKSRSFKMPVIYIDVQAQQNRWMLLLAFLALQIHLTRQRHAAAAAT